MEFHPTPSVNTTNPGVMMQGNQCCAPQQSCGSCCQTKKERSNVISTETIAFHTVTNVFLWSMAALVIGVTPGTTYNVNQDGQVQGDTNIFILFQKTHRYSPPGILLPHHPTS